MHPNSKPNPYIWHGSRHFTISSFSVCWKFGGPYFFGRGVSIGPTCKFHRFLGRLIHRQKRNDIMYLGKLGLPVQYFLSIMRKVLGSWKFLVPSKVLIIQWRAQPLGSSYRFKCHKMHLFKRAPCVGNTYPDVFFIFYFIYKRHAVPSSCASIRRTDNWQSILFHIWHHILHEAKITPLGKDQSNYS